MQIPGFFGWLLDQAWAVLPEQATGAVEQADRADPQPDPGQVALLGIVVVLWSGFAAAVMRCRQCAEASANDKPKSQV